MDPPISSLMQSVTLSQDDDNDIMNHHGAGSPRRQPVTTLSVLSATDVAVVGPHSLDTNTNTNTNDDNGNAVGTAPLSERTARPTVNATTSTVTTAAVSQQLPPMAHTVTSSTVTLPSSSPLETDHALSNNSNNNSMDESWNSPMAWNDSMSSSQLWHRSSSSSSSGVSSSSHRQPSHIPPSYPPPRHHRTRDPHRLHHYSSGLVQYDEASCSDDPELSVSKLPLVPAELSTSSTSFLTSSSMSGSSALGRSFGNESLSSVVVHTVADQYVRTSSLPLVAAAESSSKAESAETSH